MTITREEFDFVVVGSGAGGGPLAANLALAGFSVLVLEAGSAHDCGYYQAPIMQAYASEDPNMSWQFFARHFDDDAAQAADTKYVPERGGVLYPRGSTIGGSTAVSAMVMIYPHASDWNNLATLTGDESWNADAMRPFFERLESWRGVPPQPMPGDDETARDEKASHGLDGWLPTTRANPSVGGREPMFLDIIGAIEKTARQRFGIDESVSLPRDPNAADTPEDFQGMGFVPVAIEDGQRRGSRERLLDVAERPDSTLTIRTEALATKVLIEDGRAVGVEYLDGAHLYAAAPEAECELTGDREPRTADPATRTVYARREVILAGGAFNTPQLLKLSGIGPRAELERHGIDVVLDAPGVGENLHDRYEVTVLDEVDRPYPIFEGSALDVPADAANSTDPLWSEWRDKKDGPFSTNGSLAALIAKSSVAEDASDLIVFSLPIDFHGYYPGYSKDAVAKHTMLSTLILKGHTRNRAGSVTLRDASPTSTPHIAFRNFDEGSDGYEKDLEGVVDGIEIARQIASNLEEMTATEIVPGADVASREELSTFVHDQAWGHHACGTAKIGTADDPMAVLDGDFRVRGIDGLRVVDASAFPDIPGFFIVSAVYMVSEKASDVIVAQNR